MELEGSLLCSQEPTTSLFAVKLLVPLLFVELNNKHKTLNQLYK
jgi:hypothetical protein